MGFLAELKRRNVFRVALAYVVIAWLIMQVGDTMAPALRLDESVNSVLAFFLILGFPLALFFAWVFEMTPEGLKFERDVDRNTSITTQTGKKFDRLIIVVLAIAVAYFALDKFVIAPQPESEQVQTAEDMASQEPLVSDQSIAVLPFADLSPAGDQEYFSDGIAEEILNVLVRVDDLSVASRTSSFGFKGQEALGIPTIAEKLKVRHVLEGSVRKAGDTVRITAQLIDAQTDQHLWSETYDRQLTAESIFAIQDEIAQAIVARLGFLMDEQAVKADTQNLDAYDLYLQAHKVFIERSDILGAIDLFEQTVALDPGFGRAVAGLAAAYTVAPSWGHIERDYIRLATETARRAIEIDPKLAIAYSVLGYAAEDARDFHAAIKWHDKAIQTDPKDPTVWLWRGILFNELGFFDQAASDTERCLDLDPMYTNCMRHRARTALFSGNEDLAVEYTEKAMLLGFGVETMMLPVYAARGNDAFVLAIVSARFRERGFVPLIDYQYRAIVEPGFDFSAEREEIQAVYRAATGDELDWGMDDQFDPLTFGEFEAVQTAFALQPWWQPYPAGFHDTPHRKRVIREAGLPEFWRSYGFPPQCRPVGRDDFECDRPQRRTPGADRNPVGAPN